VAGYGSVEATLTPQGWSAAEVGTVGILYGTGSGNPALWVEGGTWRARIDGTTNLDSGVAPAAGVPHRVRLRWASSIQSVEVWSGATLLARVSSAFDGSLWTTGQWQLAPQAPVRVRDFRVLRNG
jgi:hypothetical protein